MQAQIDTVLQGSDVTGMAVASIKNGVIDYDGVGEFDGQPITAQTILPVASLTKPVFVYGVLQLVQQGILDLDRPLQSYLPEPYMDDQTYLPQITARHTMTHTAGFPNWRDAHGLRINFSPGTKFSYSSEGLTYLQYVVEHIIQMSMADYLQQQVFVPLGMTHTSLRPETDTTIPPFLSFLIPTVPANGALSLWTTVEDYARFVMTMLDAPTSDPSIQQMLTPHIAVGAYPDLHWGLGWGLQHQGDDLSFWHWGARGMPQTMNFVVGWREQRQAVVMLTNHAHGLVVCRALLNKLYPQKSFPAFDWLLPANRWRPDGFPPTS